MSKVERKYDEAKKQHEAAQQHVGAKESISSASKASSIPESNQASKSQFQPEAAHSKVDSGKAKSHDQSAAGASEGPCCPSKSGGKCPGVKELGQCKDASCITNSSLLCNPNPLKNAKEISNAVVDNLRHALACHGVGENCLDALGKAERLYTRLTMIERELLYPEMQRLMDEETNDIENKDSIKFAIEAFHLEHDHMDSMFKLSGQYTKDQKIVHSPEFKHFILIMAELFKLHSQQEDAIWEKLNFSQHTDAEDCKKMNQRFREIFHTVQEDKTFSGAPSGVGLAIDKVVKFFSGKSASKPEESQEKSDLSQNLSQSIEKAKEKIQDVYEKHVSGSKSKADSKPDQSHDIKKQSSAQQQHSAKQPSQHAAQQPSQQSAQKPQQSSINK